MTSAAPLILRDTSSARLPATYTAAQQAIAQLERVDECKSWSDKAAALASYARQAKDDSLRVMAVRIQARAERRCGELLKQIPRGDQATRFGQDGTVPPVTRTSAAAEAGLSERQRKTALRIAAIPDSEFEAAVEAGHPPSITELAQIGVEPRGDMPVVDLGELRSFARFCAATNPASFAALVPSSKFDELAATIGEIDSWLDRFMAALPTGL